jgi:hypothetical protein
VRLDAGLRGIGRHAWNVYFLTTFAMPARPAPPSRGGDEEGTMTLRSKFMRELRAFGLARAPDGEVDLGPVTEADLQLLPETARRYLRFMRVVDRPRDWSFRLGMTGRFRRSATEAWMRCEAWQYNTRLGLARIFYMKLRFFGFVPVLGRDTYADGRGRMLIRLIDLVTVGDGTGEAYDVGELVTYLNDGIMIAPTMLLVPDVSWYEVDARSFDLTIADHGRTVRARVFVDERGAPVDFETTDRFMSDPKDPSNATRCRWTTPIADWQAVEGRMLPTRGKAIWHPEGKPELAYAEFAFDPEALAFNVAPGE